MIKRFFLLFLLIMIDPCGASAQKDSMHIARNNIYLEAGGVGGYGSANYERIVHTGKKLSLAIRLGMSTYHVRDYTTKFNPDILVPLFVNTCYGKDHKIECGFGQTMAAIVQARATDRKPTRITNFHACFSIGYRYQKNTGGLLLRCAYTPIIDFNKYLRHWAGFSIGYSF